MNALDGLDEDRRVMDTQTQIHNLASIGLTATNFDLRDVTPKEAADAFGRPDFIWVRGGNVFTLRMAMARSGIDHVIIDGLAADRFVYAGFSAGCCVLAPSLVGLELCDPLSDCRAAYGEVRVDGLAVLDRPVVPHLHSPGSPETGMLSDIAARYDATQCPFWPLEDGQALLVNGCSSRIHT